VPPDGGGHDLAQHGLAGAGADVPAALLFGLFSLIYGISQITLGIQLCQTGKTLHSVLEDAA
jgi:hypothetical protein